VLDAFAILGLLRDEPCADHVERLLRSVANISMSSINLGEVIYKTTRAHGAERAQDVLLHVGSYDMDIIDPDRELVVAAAFLKGLHRMSYADCFAAALAMRLNAALVTGDRDFHQLEGTLTIEWLPEASA
jgi:ribonuclease VapC